MYIYVSLLVAIIYLSMKKINYGNEYDNWTNREGIHLKLIDVT